MTEEQQPKVVLYYDGACSICRRKMSWFKRRDKRQRLSFEDISAAGFSPQKLGLNRLAMNSSLHLRTAEGVYLKDLDAIHHAYCALGLGWLTAPIRVRGLRQLSDYLFARWKLRVRGRHSVKD